ncbi:2813_t:CDS:2, partial [Acaulospora colombiana]
MNAPGTKSAIPSKFEMKPDNLPSSNGVYIDEADNEIVFDLEPSRYPFKIQLEEQLPKRMIEQFRHIISDKPINPEFQKYWDKRHRLVFPPIRSSSDTHLLLLDFWTLATRYLKYIQPKHEYQPGINILTQDRRVLTDVYVRMGSKIVIVADAIDPALDDIYAADLVSLAAGKQSSSFEGDIPEVIHGHEAILSKLCYAIMDECEEKPRWAMIYGGNNYVIYLVLPVLVGSTRRCVLVSSGALSIDDTETPFVSIMMYMLLSSDMSHESIAKTLGIEPIAGVLITASNQIGELNGNASEPAPVDFIYISSTLDPSAQLPFTRLPSDLKPTEDSHYGNEDSLNILLQYRIAGLASIVYQANGILAKTPLPSFESEFEDEVDTYRHLMRTKASQFIPTFYGCFKYRNAKIMILSDDGTSLQSFDGLSEQLRYGLYLNTIFYSLGESRQEIFNMLWDIHEAHVDIPGFGPNSVVIGGNGPTIILIGASMNHVCPGTLKCDMLQNARPNLGIIDTNKAISHKMKWIQDTIRQILGHKVEISEQEYFLPEVSGKAGHASAIPRRFEMEPENSSRSNGIYVNEDDEEHVYYLEPFRYPYTIQFEEDLPKRMIEQLQRVLRDDPIDPIFREYWDARHTLVSPPIRSISDVTLFLFDFWNLSIRYLRHIQPEIVPWVEFGAITQDRRIRTDLYVKTRSKTI